MFLPESFFDSILRASMITASCAIALRIQPGPVVSLRACLHGDFGSLAMAATRRRFDMGAIPILSRRFGRHLELDLWQPGFHNAKP